MMIYYYLLGSILAILITIGDYYNKYDPYGEIRLIDMFNKHKNMKIYCIIAFIFSWCYILISIIYKIYNKIKNEIN